MKRVHPEQYIVMTVVSTTGSVDHIKSKSGWKGKMSTKYTQGLFFCKTIMLRNKKMAGRTMSAAIMVVFVFFLYSCFNFRCCLI